MHNGQSIAVAIAFSVLTGLVAAQGQALVPPAGGRGGQGGGSADPARGVTINQNVNQKASAKIAGEQISGTVTLTSYTTRFNLGPLSPLDADGAAIVIHQNPDAFQTGTKGQGVGGGNAIACGVIVK